MKKIVSFILSIIILLGSFAIGSNAQENISLDVLEFPEEAVSVFSEEILERASTAEPFEANKGYKDSGTYISPYWECQIGQKNIPVYSSLTYDYKTDIGVLQSYSHIWIALTNKAASITLSSIEPNVRNAIVLPKSKGIVCDVSGENIAFDITEYGIYTVLINDDSMQYAFTLFVEEYTDEEAEIENYKNKYGEENVAVFDKKYYELDTIDLNNFKAVYFRRGSYFKATHLYDISDEASLTNIPVKRTFLNVQGKTDFVIDGFGTFDFNSCDWKEVDPMSVTDCKNGYINGLNFINPSHWTFYTYACENLTVNNISTTGYRMNSDGINICNSKNILVENSFARTGDDSFSVKTMNPSYTAENICFDSCVAWSTKARCFGITGEVEADISDVTFKNCSVVNRSATWDNDRLGSLCIIVENGKGNIDGVTFENIEIHNDDGRAINCTVYGESITDCQIKNVSFKNITYNGKEKLKISSNNHLNFSQKLCVIFYRFLTALNLNCSVTTKLFEYLGGNFVSVTFENVTSGKIKITKYNQCFFVKKSGCSDLNFISDYC